MNFLRNKKASISIVILVVLTLFVTSSALILFYNSKPEVKLFFDDSNSLALMRNNQEFFIKEAIQLAVLNSYLTILEETYYIKNPRLEEDIYFFDNLKEKNLIDRRLTDLANNYLIENFDLFKENNFNLKISGEEVVFDLNDFKVLVSESNYYIFDINNSFTLAEMGLIDFNEIYLALGSCKTNEKKESCLSQRLNGFNVRINEKESYEEVILSSKKSFYIEGELKPVIISFAQSL